MFEKRDNKLQLLKSKMSGPRATYIWNFRQIVPNFYQSTCFRSYELWELWTNVSIVSTNRNNITEHGRTKGNLNICIPSSEDGWIKRMNEWMKNDTRDSDVCKFNDSIRLKYTTAMQYNQYYIYRNLQWGSSNA